MTPSRFQARRLTTEERETLQAIVDGTHVCTAACRAGTGDGDVNAVALARSHEPKFAAQLLAEDML